MVKMNETYQKAVQYYLENENESTTDVAKKFNIDRGTFYNKLKALGIPSRSKREKYSFNRQYFNNIDTEDKAYWLGFLLADGNNTGATLRIRLKATDKELLEKFNVCINGNIEIKIEDGTGYTEGQKNNVASLVISSREMCRAVMQYGIIPNKTALNREPMYNFHNPQLQNAFIRGIFDGDGWCYFSSNSNEVGISGTKELCQSIKEYLTTELGIENISESEIDSIYRIRICNKAGILKFYHSILENKEELYLKRKYDLVKNYAVLNETTN